LKGSLDARTVGASPDVPPLVMVKAAPPPATSTTPAAASSILRRRRRRASASSSLVWTGRQCGGDPGGASSGRRGAPCLGRDSGGGSKRGASSKARAALLPRAQAPAAAQSAAPLPPCSAHRRQGVWAWRAERRLRWLRGRGGPGLGDERGRSSRRPGSARRALVHRRLTQAALELFQIDCFSNPGGFTHRHQPHTRSRAPQWARESAGRDAGSSGRAQTLSAFLQGRRRQGRPVPTQERWSKTRPAPLAPKSNLVFLH
jgi:hypothetical protein